MKQIIYKCCIILFAVSINGCSNFIEKEKIEIEGKRIPINTFDQRLTANTTLEKLKINNSTIKNKNWQYFDTLNSYSNQWLPENLKLIRKFKFSIRGRLPIISYPVITDDALIYMDKSGIVYNYNTLTGKLRWKNKEFLERKIYHDYLNGGLSFQDNMLFATLGSDIILCIDIQTGKLLWKNKLQNITRSIPYIANDKVIIQTLNNGVYALSKTSGEIIWSNLGVGSNTSVLYTTSPVIYTDFIILQGANGKVRYIDIDNGFEVQSIKSTNDIVDIFYLDNSFNEEMRIYQPIIKQQIIYYYDETGNFYALNLDTGVNRWKKKFDISIPFAINGDTIYAVDKYDELLAIDCKTGNLYFKINLNDFVNKKDKSKIFWTTPVIVNSKIKVLNSSGKLLTFDPINNKLLNTMDVSIKSYIQPVIADGKMYITSSLGEIAQYGDLK